MVKHEITKLIQQAIRKAQKKGDLPSFTIPEIPLEHPRQAEHGDYATPICLQLARLARMAPVKIADILIKYLPETDYLGNEAEAAPQPGENGWSEPIYFYDDLIDPAAFFGDSADCIYYAFSYLTVPESRPAQMWVGSPQELAVWLNGEQVYKYDGTYRNHLLPNDVVEVNVKAGVNRILVKAGQRDGISQFSLNICETETDKNYAGNRLAGAKFLYWVEPERMKGDYNGDDRVDIMDLISLLRVLGESERSPEYDFNADGKVDIFDLIGLLKYLSENR